MPNLIPLLMIDTGTIIILILIILLGIGILAFGLIFLLLLIFNQITNKEMDNRSIAKNALIGALIVLLISGMICGTMFI